MGPIAFTYGPVKGTASLSVPVACAADQPCPPQLAIQFAELDAGKLQAALLGAQKPDTLLSTLIARLTTSKPPVWPRIDAQVTADSLVLGPFKLQNATASLHIEPAAAEITSFNAGLLGGQFTLTGKVANGGKPAYALEGKFDKLSAPAVCQLLALSCTGGTVDGRWQNQSLRLLRQGPRLLRRWQPCTSTGIAAPLPTIPSLELPAALARFDRFTADAVIASGAVTLKQSQVQQGRRKSAINAAITFGDPPKISFAAPQAAPVRKAVNPHFIPAKIRPWPHPQNSSAAQIQCKGILFDMDGILISSISSVERSWTKWANLRGMDPAYACSIAHGCRAIETIAKLRPDLDPEAELKIIEDIEVADGEGLTVLPGVLEMLAASAKDRWTVVTSATERLASARMADAGIPVPERIVTAEHVIRGKPHPEPFLAGAAMLGFAPQDCVVFRGFVFGCAGGPRRRMHRDRHHVFASRRIPALPPTTSSLTSPVSPSRLTVTLSRFESGPSTLRAASLLTDSLLPVLLVRLDPPSVSVLQWPRVHLNTPAKARNCSRLMLIGFSKTNQRTPSVHGGVVSEPM